MSASPTEALRIAVDTVLQPSTVLADDKVYLEGSEALRTAVFPFVVIGTSTETPEGEDRYNGQWRHQSTMQLRCWGQDKAQAEQAYIEVKARLDNAPLTLTGHGTTRGRVTKIADLAEPKPAVAGHQVIALFRVVSQVAA